MTVHIGGGITFLKLMKGQHTYEALVPERYPGANKIYDGYYLKFMGVCNRAIPLEELFTTQCEIRFALLLSSDGILPDLIQRRLSLLTIQAMNEALDNKIKLASLKIAKPPSGRKGVEAKKYVIYSKILKLRKDGYSLEEAKNQIANEHFLSIETVQQHYNSVNKKLGGFRK